MSSVCLILPYLLLINTYSSFKFQLIPSIFREGSPRSNRSNPPILPTYTKALLYNTFCIFRLIFMYFLQPASKTVPNTPCFLGAASMDGSRADLCDESNTAEVTSETGFSKPVNSILASLSLITCSGGSPIISSPMERVPWSGNKAAYLQPHEQSWKCLEVLESLSNLPRL